MVVQVGAVFEQLIWGLILMAGVLLVLGIPYELP